MRARYHRYQENVTHASDPTRSTDSWPDRRLYSSETSRIRRLPSSPGGTSTSSSLERSFWTSPSESRHWPWASRTVRAIREPESHRISEERGPRRVVNDLAGLVIAPHKKLVLHKMFCPLGTGRPDSLSTSRHHQSDGEHETNQHCHLDQSGFNLKKSLSRARGPTNQHHRIG